MTDASPHPTQRKDITRTQPPRQTRAWLVLSLVLSTLASLAHSEPEEINPLVFSYWTDATPPFAIVEKQTIVDGIIKNIGDEIGERIDYPVSFRRIPVARIEQSLVSGDIHVDCITSPIWKENAEAYGWSPVLFKGADRFLIRKNTKDVVHFSDIKGRQVGIYNGYTYHPVITEMFAKNEAQDVQVRGIKNGTDMVVLGRLDTLIDFGTILKYHIKQHPQGHLLTLASKHADDYNLQCAYSQKMPIPQDTVNNAIQHMLADGTMRQILKQYE